MSAAPDTDLATLERLAAPAGQDVIDVGCGGGALVRDLSALGSRVIGVEVSPAQLAAAVAADDGSGARYLVGCAQDLPLADSAADLVVFMRALHHVAPADLIAALTEARRVLRPGGIVYVAEPLAEGDFFSLTSLVEDELVVRRAAQEALAQAAQAGLRRTVTVDYDVRFCLPGLDALRRRMVSVDPGRAAIFDARAAELARAFASGGEAGERPGERCFVQPMRADVLHAVAA